MWKINIKDIFPVIRYVVVTGSILFELLCLQSCSFNSAPNLQDVRSLDVKQENIIGVWSRAADEECRNYQNTRLTLKQDLTFEANLPTTFFDSKGESLCRSTQAEGSWKLGEDTEGNSLVVLQIAGFGLTTLNFHKINNTLCFFTYLGDADAGQYLLLRKDDSPTSILKKESSK